MDCHMRWCRARHFTINPTHAHEFYWDELDTQKPHQVFVTNILNFLLFECKIFSFDLFSNINLSYVMIGYMNVICRELDTFKFIYIPWGIWSLVSVSLIALFWHCWDALSRSDNATVWTISAYTGLCCCWWWAAQY